MAISYYQLINGSVVLHNTDTNTDTYENGLVIEHTRKVKPSSKRILLDMDEFLYIREHSKLVTNVKEYERIYMYIDQLSYFSPRNNSCFLSTIIFQLPNFNV